MDTAGRWTEAGPPNTMTLAQGASCQGAGHAILAPGTFDPTDYTVFQAIFGAIFTVIIALEFKRSLLVVAQRQESIVQVRTVILLALLAIVRKVMIIDLTSTNAMQLFALAAAILALGAVYWLVRDRDRSIEREALARAEGAKREVKGSKLRAP